MAIRNALPELLKFLQKMEKKEEFFTVEELLHATGWKQATFRAYKSKGQLSDFVSSVGNGYYQASNTLALSGERFQKLLSQSKNRRGIGCSTLPHIARALLRKSKDNMSLALELYNRPSLENRLDGFIMLFCVAWEQLLKAIIIENEGENAIYRKQNGQMLLRQTLSLRECIDKIFDLKNPIGRNINRIVALRDEAVHFLMPELQGIMSKIFQSGIFNFANKFEKIAKQPFLEIGTGGMFSLVTDCRCPSISFLKDKYGDIAQEMLELSKRIEHEIENINDIEFAIPLNVSIKIVKTEADGAFKIIKQEEIDNGIEGLRKALLIEKPISFEETHQFREKAAISSLYQRLKENIKFDELGEYLCCIDKKTKIPYISSHCFQAMIYKTKYKNGNNEFHHATTNPENHYYSEKLIERLLSNILKDKNYIKSAKGSYTSRKDG